MAAFAPFALGQGDTSSHAERIRATQAMSRWFDCYPCGAGELEAVAQSGSSVVPSLAAALKGGQSAAGRELKRRLLAARYDELEEQAGKDPRFAMKSTKEEFIARYLGNLDTRHRIRAAQALGRIGDAKARKALEAALADAPSAQVRTAIERALKEIKIK